MQIDPITNAAPHSAAGSDARPQTLHGIQLLRAVAAMLVALFHGHQAFVAAGANTHFASESYLFSFGAVGVHVFFVISGFIMVHTTSFAGGFSARRFLRRRLLRIYPIYWICAALYLAVHLAIAKPYDLTPAQMLGALLLVPGDAPRIIGPAWTLSFEMYFYICFGLFMMLGLTRGLLALAAFFCAMIVIHPFTPWRGSAINLASSALLLEFLAGCAIGWLNKTGRLPTLGGAAVLALGLALFGAGTAIGFERYPSIVMWGVPSALVVAGLVMMEVRSGAAPLVERIGRLGESSYALYLIHILIITLGLTVVGKTAASYSPIAAALVLGVIAQLVAEGLHRRIEKPLLRRLNRGGPVPGVPDSRQSTGQPAE